MEPLARFRALGTVMAMGLGPIAITVLWDPGVTSVNLMQGSKSDVDQAEQCQRRKLKSLQLC